MYTTKYTKNQPKPAVKKQRVKKYSEGGAVENDDEGAFSMRESSRETLEDYGKNPSSTRSEAINIGRAYPGQIAGQYGTAKKK